MKRPMHEDEWNEGEGVEDLDLDFDESDPWEPKKRDSGVRRHRDGRRDERLDDRD